VRVATFPILLLTAVAVAAQSPKIRPKYKTIESGLAYAHVTVTNFGITNIPWSIHIARMEQSRRDLELVATLAKGHIEGLSTVAEQAASLDPAKGRAIAAVNGDFFVIKAGPYQGDPQGLQICDGELVSGPTQASLWVENQRLHMKQVQSRLEVRWPDGTSTPMGLNESPTGKVAVLFTPSFGASTRATNFFELALGPDGDKPWLPLRANRHYRARVLSWNIAGNSPLRADEMILTLSKNFTNHLSSASPGAVVEISTALSEDIGDATAAIGGWPLLVSAGKVQTRESNARKNSYLVPRHPRTAVGYNRRYVFLVEVDGRQPSLAM